MFWAVVVVLVAISYGLYRMGPRPDPNWLDDDPRTERARTDRGHAES